MQKGSNFHQKHVERYKCRQLVHVSFDNLGTCYHNQENIEMGMRVNYVLRVRTKARTIGTLKYA